jgi:CxxC motif-containing protein
MANLFDKVKSGLDKGLSTVSAKSQEVLEVTKIKNRIGSLKEQITNTQTKLGEVVYQMYLQDGFDQSGIQEKCESIKALENQIKDKEAELQGVHIKAAEAMGKTFCDDCKTEITEGTKFCGQCGKKTDGV